MATAYLAALVTAAMGGAFLLADPRTPTSRALAGALIFAGFSIAGNVLLLQTAWIDGLWGRLVPVFDSAAIMLAYEWVARLRRTLPPRTDLNTRFGDRLVRAAQGIVLVYLALGLLYPGERATYFLNAANLEQVQQSGWFYAFTAPLEISLLLAGVSMLLLLNRGLDLAERKRLLAMCVALPVMMLGLVLPLEWAPFVTVLGAMVLLVGAIQYHVEQGRRSEFLGRFLSPAVAGLVRSEGLMAMRRETRVVSVIHCDIRGFTQRCGSLDSEQILDLLRQFYAAVGRACAQHGATIKDYAGDGVMMLVGAPLATPNPAERAAQLAQDLHRECAGLLSTWSTPEAPIGLAVGIATGPVTLGVIGALRLEYVAVGATVNLAARLCESAASGETLLDQPGTRVSTPPRNLSLKGFGDAVPAYLAC